MIFLLGIVAFVIELVILWVNVTAPPISHVDARSRPPAVVINAFLLFWTACALIRIYDFTFGR